MVRFFVVLSLNIKKVPIKYFWNCQYNEFQSRVKTIAFYIISYALSE
ncbi:hypothetical protein HMPREF0204_14349 [Chryseobacterium gleum ATCC 35910]|uniref:Uncharacterized protein n=1 Tax=Chryseobacterium gleum ATCC 35910 TaxID=525257 RepID=A0ABN0AQF2_CHRGE|nr:hypothetical protein HMPREF0204_14349 [Chryseobacterium gleum ATCC 35910]